MQAYYQGQKIKSPCFTVPHTKKSNETLDDNIPKISDLYNSSTPIDQICMAPNITWEQTQPSAILYAPDTGIKMRLFTTEPGLQIYNATGMQCQTMGIHPYLYQSQAAIALETHIAPDAVHHSNFPSITLPKNCRRLQATCLDFSSH